jgi:actin-related protein 3
MTTKPPIVIDNGTGYTKMGYAGNSVPDYIVPTIIANPEKKTNVKVSDTADLEFYIGSDAVDKRLNYTVENILSHGIIDDWDNIEKYWQRCFFQWMRCDPEEHYVLLTEPPLNPPENREYTAEIMFETFNVPGMYIGVQAVLALIASRLAKDAEKILTGTVIDSGDGVTHIIPVVDGYVIGSCIKHIPLAGSDITKFVMELLRNRNEDIPPEDIKMVARKVKEQFSYVAPDMVKEFLKYDEDPERFKIFEGEHPKTKKPYKVDIGYERFLGPELFFNPEIYSSQHVSPLPDMIDSTIQLCPIDTRKRLYKNIVLSGGSTMFKDFAKRLERDVNRLCKKRFGEQKSKLLSNSSIDLQETEVKVIQHRMQRFAVWFGGSMLGSLPQFYEMAHSKKAYEEFGPSIARNNPVFSGI